MKKISLFVKESWSEFFNKVTWPTWLEVQKTAGVVIIATIFFSLVIYAMDLGIGNILNFIYEALV